MTQLNPFAEKSTNIFNVAKAPRNFAPSQTTAGYFKPFSSHRSGNSMMYATLTGQLQREKENSTHLMHHAK